ncbi:phage tail assembly chaperone, partial [Pseudomonas aeruginosa]|uniref:phage tail assembly chaperone n=1 Tax=Pseudomonas aeruginosa TaxID=287 RepID=UPI00396872CF
MAKKFSIAQAPTFESSVEIPRLGGESIKVPFTFKYLDRVALAAPITWCGAWFGC